MGNQYTNTSWQKVITTTHSVGIMDEVEKEQQNPATNCQGTDTATSTALLGEWSSQSYSMRSRQAVLA